MRVGSEQVLGTVNKGWLKAITRVALALALILSMNAPPPAKANWSDSLFDRLASVLKSAGVDPDQIEMARFTIEYPTQAANVYEHAAANDYPYFALVGAAKAAKGKNFGKLGTFTEASCNFPLTAIDTVFARASNKIEGQAAGIANTDAAMGVATSYFKQAMKESSDEGRRALNNQMIQSIPYFSDIEPICTFSFHTNFSTESNLQQMATDKAQDIKAAYDAFHSGNVVSGVGKIIKLGVGKNAACKLVDDGVSGGVIGRTPYLGALATKACEGFAGVVIDGVLGFVKGGVGIVEAGVSYVWEAGKEGLCKVASFFGSGCSTAEPPPPPTAESNAAAWCSGRGGVEGLKTAANAPEDYTLNCKDGSKCVAKPGKTPRCATAAEFAANRKQRIDTAAVQFQVQLPKWKANFRDRWRARCLNADPCLAAITLMANGLENQATILHEKTLDADFNAITYVLFSQAERDAANTIEEYKYKVLPDRWAADFGGRWKAVCSDDLCRTQAEFAVKETVTDVRKIRKNDQHAPYSKATPWFVNAEQYASTSIEESAARAASGVPAEAKPITPPPPSRQSGGWGGPIRTAPTPSPRPAATTAPTARAPISRTVTPVTGRPTVTRKPFVPPPSSGGRSGPRTVPAPSPTPSSTPTPQILRRK
jgi:hypothetical protein